MPSGKKRKRHKVATHKRKKRRRANRHKKKQIVKSSFRTTFFSFKETFFDIESGVFNRVHLDLLDITSCVK